MKHGKRPTRKQAVFLSSKRLNYRNWLVINETKLEILIVHRLSDKTRTIQKERDRV